MVHCSPIRPYLSPLYVRCASDRENVWGIWNGITPRDGEAIRRIGQLLRFLGNRGYLQSPDWVPHDLTLKAGVLFSSRWPLKDGSTAWTIVNRGNPAVNFSGPALAVPAGLPANICFYDL
jgi:iron(II)-dependent oxidoreductase